MKKRKIFKVIITLMVSGISCFALDRNDLQESENGLHDTFCDFREWMYPMVSNIFNKQSNMEQKYFRRKIIKYSYQLASFSYGDREYQESISFFLNKIADNKNPINTTPSLVINDENNQYHNMIYSISNILYKLFTHQIIFLNKKFIDYKLLNYINTNPYHTIYHKHFSSYFVETEKPMH